VTFPVTSGDVFGDLLTAVTLCAQFTRDRLAIAKFLVLRLQRTVKRESEPLTGDGGYVETVVVGTVQVRLTSVYFTRFRLLKLTA